MVALLASCFLLPSVLTQSLWPQPLLLNKATACIGPSRIRATISPLQSNTDQGTESLTYRLNHLFLKLTINEIEAYDSKSILWKLKLPSSGYARFLRKEGDLLYVAISGSSYSGLATSQAVWSVEIKTGKVLAEYALPAFSKPWTIQTVEAITHCSNGIAILTRLQVDPTHRDGKSLDNFRLVFFGPDGKMLWWDDWGSKPSFIDPNLQIEATDPTSLDSPNRKLQRIGNRLLFCANTQEPIRVIDSANGKELSAVSEIWDYKRIFLGPSVFRYFVTRDKREIDSTYLPEKPLRNPPSGTILSGPVLVSQAQNSQSRLAYVVAARYNSNSFDEERAVESFLYEIEIDQFGSISVKSITPLPQVVFPSQVQTLGSSVVWGCNGGGLLHVSPSSNVLPDRNPWKVADCVGKIDWYRTFARPKVSPEPWLSSDPDPAAVVFEHDRAIRTIGPAYISHKGDKTIHFPMAVIDLDSGRMKRFEIEVSVSKGLEEKPEFFPSDDMTIPDLSIQNHMLSMSLKLAKKTFKLVFDIFAFNEAIRQVDSE